MDRSVSRDFMLSEFQCPCGACITPLMPAQSIIDVVQWVRTRTRRPVKITSAIRCAAHNRAVAGEDDSRHLPQYADGIDMLIADGKHLFVVLKAVFEYYQMTPINIGIYPDHLHIDCRGPGGMSWVKV